MYIDHTVLYIQYIDQVNQPEWEGAYRTARVGREVSTVTAWSYAQWDCQTAGRLWGWCEIL